jgi:hypothetical protein
MLRYLLAAPGEISMTDLDLAVASQAMVLGFNVTPSEAVQVGCFGDCVAHGVWCEAGHGAGLQGHAL